MYISMDLSVWIHTVTLILKMTELKYPNLHYCA